MSGALAPASSGDERTAFERWQTGMRHLVADAQVVATAARGTATAEFERGWPVTPDILVLRGLAHEAELRGGLVEAGLARCERILDAGCGPGMISRLLAEIGGADVVAVDKQPALLDFARTLPRPARGSATFRHVDIAGGAPFADASFDAVFVGDMWLPGMLAELRRVTRPGGLIVLKLCAMLPTLTYAWDRALDLRTQLALVESSRRCFGVDAHADGVWRTRVASMGPWQSVRAFSVLIERFNPVPAAFEELERQLFATSSGPLIRDAVDDDEWAKLAPLWDRASQAYVFSRPDGHFVRSLHFVAAQMPGGS